MMAQNVRRSRAPALISLVFTVFYLANCNAVPNINVGVSINSVKFVNESSLPYLGNEHDESRFLVEVTGVGIFRNLPLARSFSKSDCDDGKYALRQVSVEKDGTRAVYELVVPDNAKVTKVYFCTEKESSHFGDVWTNLGPDHAVVLPHEPNESRSKRQIKVAQQFNTVEADNQKSSNAEIRIEGLRIETADKDPSYTEQGVPVLLAHTNAAIRLFGTGITYSTLIGFTEVAAERGVNCENIRTDFPVYNVRNDTALIKVNLPLGKPYYICAKASNSTHSKHQGNDTWLMVETYSKPLPFWLTICVILFCLAASALYSGLNLGLMSLDVTELKILCNTGTEKERRYARTIQPVRKHGNYLLCAILLANVFVNSIFTILLDDLTSGVIAVIFSTLSIVIIGEISPQAFCSRYGLEVGARTIWVTKITMVLTFPLAYPISKLLDLLLGEEIGNVYNRERIKELVQTTTNDLEKDEVNIISGALELRKKTVSDVMTRIEDVYMLSYDTVLDFETVSDIMKSGYSRIPVYEGSRPNIITMFYTKDLAFIDPDDNTPLKTLCQFYQNSCNFVFEDVTLDVMFRQFKEGHKGHMAFVHRVNNEGEGDPFYEVIGLITLEDVIEELIQAEIMDETDVFTDNRSKRKRLARPKDFTVFAEKKENQRIHISPQLTLAMFQYLSTTVEPFKPDTISETILRRLLKQDIIYHIKMKKSEKARNDPSTVIYQQGKPVDYFVLILEGRVEVTVGRENMMFESGPFTYFGTQALTANIGLAAESPVNASPQALGSIQSINLDSMLRHTFVPDYSVRAVTEVFYVKIKRSLYLAAKRASLMERSQKDPQPSQDQFDDEVEKLLHSMEEDDRSVPGSPTLQRSTSGKDKGNDGSQTPIIVTAPTSPLPVSASPVTNAKFISPKKDKTQNGEIKNSPIKIQEQQQIPPATQSGLDLDAEIRARTLEAARLSSLKGQEDEERTNLLPKQDRS